MRCGKSKLKIVKHSLWGDEVYCGQRCRFADQFEEFVLIGIIFPIIYALGYAVMYFTGYDVSVVSGSTLLLFMLPSAIFFTLAAMASIVDPKAPMVQTHHYVTPQVNRQLIPSKKLQPCCYQTARHGDKYCVCGSLIPDELIQKYKDPVIRLKDN